MGLVSFIGGVSITSFVLERSANFQYSNVFQLTIQTKASKMRLLYLCVTSLRATRCFRNEQEKEKGSDSQAAPEKSEGQARAQEKIDLHIKSEKS